MPKRRAKKASGPREPYPPPKEYNGGDPQEVDNIINMMQKIFMPDHPMPVTELERAMYMLRNQRKRDPLGQTEVRQWIEAAERFYGLKPMVTPDGAAIVNPDVIIDSNAEIDPDYGVPLLWKDGRPVVRERPKEPVAWPNPDGQGVWGLPGGPVYFASSLERQLWYEEWTRAARQALAALLRHDFHVTRDFWYAGADYLRLLADLALWRGGAPIKRGTRTPGPHEVKFPRRGTGKREGFAKDVISSMIRYLMVFGDDWPAGRPDHVPWEPDELAYLRREYNAKTVLGRRNNYPWKPDAKDAMWYEENDQLWPGEDPVADSIGDMKKEYKNGLHGHDGGPSVLSDALELLATLYRKHKRDPRLPPQGTTIKKEHDGALYEWVEYFEPEGRFHLWKNRQPIGAYHNVHQLAQAITERPTNGFEFFELNDQLRDKVDKTPPG